MPPNSYYIDTPDIGQRFRQGMGRSYAQAGNYEGAIAVDPDNAASYAGLADRQTRNREREEQRSYARDYAGALSRNDYAGAESAAARYGDVEGVTGARTAQSEASQQQREELYRGGSQMLAELEQIEASNGEGYAALIERGRQALQQNPNMDPEMRRLIESAPATFSPRFVGAVRAYATRLRDAALTPQQAATLQQQRDNESREGWAIDAYGRPYRNNGGVIERRNEQGDIVQDSAPVPVPRDRVPAPATYGPSGLNADQVRAEREYARDWRGVYDNFSSIRSEFGRIEQMASRRDSAGDLALVVSFTKMLDPGSVAREGEVALTQSAASLLAQAQTFLPRLQQGNTLLPDQVRAQLLSAAQQMYGVYSSAYNRLGQDYYTTAQDYGFDPSRVMRGYDPPQQGELGGDTNMSPYIARPSGQAPQNPGVGLQSMTDEQLDALERELSNAGR